MNPSPSDIQLIIGLMNLYKYYELRPLKLLHKVSNVVWECRVRTICAFRILHSRTRKTGTLFHSVKNRNKTVA